jgi:hypothetical protein
MSQYLSPCRSCGQLIGWDRSKNGKNIPIDPDGRIHFITCPKRLLPSVKTKE